MKVSTRKMRTSPFAGKTIDPIREEDENGPIHHYSANTNTGPTPQNVHYAMDRLPYSFPGNGAASDRSHRNMLGFESVREESHRGRDAVGTVGSNEDVRHETSAFTGAEKHRAFGVVTPEHRHGARGQRFNDQQVRDGLAYDFDREHEGVRCGVGLGGGRKGIFIRPIDVRNRTVTFAQDHDDCVGSRMSYSVTPERRYGDQGQGRGDRRGRDFDVGQERGGWRVFCI